MIDTSIFLKLAAFFPASEVGWKPQAVNGNRAMAIAYIDARNVMERLDAVVGPDNWQDEYIPLEKGTVMCKLSVRFEKGGEWITKADVGGESDQKDAGDKMKAAFSDALKRAAVKFGIGRYLYELGQQWVDYDAQKKRFTRDPVMPARFLPATDKSGEEKKRQDEQAQRDFIAQSHKDREQFVKALGNAKSADDLAKLKPDLLALKNHVTEEDWKLMMAAAKDASNRVGSAAALR